MGFEESFGLLMKNHSKYNHRNLVNPVSNKNAAPLGNTPSVGALLTTVRFRLHGFST